MFDSFTTPWTVALQVPLSMGFHRQVYWDGLPFSSPGDRFNPGIKPVSPALAGGSFTTEPCGKLQFNNSGLYFKHLKKTFKSGDKAMLSHRENCQASLIRQDTWREPAHSFMSPDGPWAGMWACNPLGSGFLHVLHPRGSQKVQGMGRSWG